MGTAIKTGARFGAVALAFALMSGVPNVSADEGNAKTLFKEMSDYMAKQKTLSFDLDSSLEVVTQDQQKLAFANSGRVTLSRPDRIHVTRKGGFADAELFFDGKNAILLDKDENAYVKAEIPGSVEHLIEELRTKFHRPLPAADLLSDNIYDEFMPLVTNVKDLGSGVIRGVECDHLAFREEDVDWQIWITQGDSPHPLRFIVTTTKLPGSPQYQVDVLNFKTGVPVTDADFQFMPPSGAKTVEAGDLHNFDELPQIYQPKQ